MSEFVNYNAERFAEAYIQTLPHVSKPEEFDSEEDFVDYMDKRRELYFNHYLDAIDFANGRAESTEDVDDK
ncbi:hypothetical protein [Staphylococcus equorum]|uniref:hypothetical protein n=1 Tax=Staphylococcus equorum TaxID=246432 RepID=UPI000853CC78|nr:hypothetical protein [Staphylococcus equorum]OEK70860.1 hypothetical protein AST02_05210 [Staphylococcus equorum]